MTVNRDGDTPLHVAARSVNASSMTAMLDTFPTLCFVGEHSNRGFESVVVSELLTTCARRGNAPAVGALIRFAQDADIGGVLRDVVDESVAASGPPDVERLLDVYRTIVDHAVSWQCARTGQKTPRPDSREYRTERRRTMLRLLTRPATTSVIRHCIQNGADRFLLAILNTPDVFRSSDGFGRYKAKDRMAVHAADRQFVTYDVTDLTPFTIRSETDEADDTG